MTGGSGRAQRALDVGLVLLAAPAALALGACAASAVALADGRPILYRQVRCGRGGQPFALLKLRTMRTGPGPDITSTGDPRITRCGAVLRHLKLDELPQLWNVLRGDMSLVGPRPELPRWVARHPDEFARAHQVRPGVTGVSSLRYRDEAAALSALVRTGAASSLDEAYDRVLLPAKLALDLDYLERRTAASDLRVLAATLWAVALRRDPEGLLRSSGSTRLHEAAA